MSERQKLFEIEAELQIAADGKLRIAAKLGVSVDASEIFRILNEAHKLIAKSAFGKARDALRKAHELIKCLPKKE